MKGFSGDIDDERDVNFLINKIKEAITKDSLPVSPNQEELIEKVVKNSDEANVIRFDSKGDSIESEKLKVQKAGGCKDKAKSLEKEHVESSTKFVEVEKEAKNITESKKENLHDRSSSIDDHAIRYDRHGNTFEEYKETEEHHDDHKESSEEKPKRKKKIFPNVVTNDDDDTVNLNSILNDEIINKQLANKKQKDSADSEDLDEDDDDIPLITIPMYDILRQIQRAQQGFVSETEEYSDETTHDVFADPHLKNILREISAERKALKDVKVDGKIVKPAAKRVFERHFGPSDESL